MLKKIWTERKLVLIFFGSSVAAIGAAAVFKAYLLFLYFPEYFSNDIDPKAKIFLREYFFTPVSSVPSRKEQGKRIFYGLEDGELILVARKTFLAADYPFIQVKLSGVTRFTRAKLLWRNDTEPEEIHGTELHLKKGMPAPIFMGQFKESYHGRILDIALLLFDGPEVAINNNDGVPITFEGVDLVPFTAPSLFRQIYSDWTKQKAWSGSHNNIVTGAAPNALILPNGFLSLVFILNIVIALALRWWLARSCGVRNIHSFRQAVIWSSIFCLLLAECLRFNWRMDFIEDSKERFFQQNQGSKVERSGIRCSRRPDCYSDLEM